MLTAMRPGWRSSLKDQVSVDFLWVAKSIFGLLYPPGADCPWEDGGRHHRMTVACFFMLFAYGLRPSNLAYDKPELLDQLLRESTVYFRMRVPIGGVEVFFSHQFAQMRTQSWFVAASVVSICVVLLKGKNWGSDKPNNPNPMVFAIVEGRSPCTDLLKDMMFQHGLDADHRPNDPFFSYTLRVTKRGSQVTHKKLLQRDVTTMLRVVAVLVGQDPSHYSLKSFRQTTATLMKRAGAEVEEGNPYWRFFQGWLSVEAPKRYVHEQLRPVNALDVIGLVGLTNTDVSAAALPSSRRTLWKVIVEEDAASRWP
jgi:hypothetical protein